MAGLADHGRHGGVDDDVAGDVQAGNALVGVDHGERGALREDGVDVGAQLERVAHALAAELGREVGQVDREVAVGFVVFAEKPRNFWAGSISQRSVARAVILPFVSADGLRMSPQLVGGVLTRSLR